MCHIRSTAGGTRLVGWWLAAGVSQALKGQASQRDASDFVEIYYTKYKCTTQNYIYQSYQSFRRVVLGWETWAGRACWVPCGAPACPDRAGACQRGLTDKKMHAHRTLP